ncbi:phytoene desaturase family protein [Pseudalkalibacillus sp. Hm43]|uniref:phytoene desaturase family protein n=1 Tax=Pseudalkalibacillus sp. Hm43 TaxID=3450742 RepID=UPI003F41CD14
MRTIKQNKIQIIGAGPGGLAAGMILSSKGYDVTIYEKQPFIGGRTSRLTLGDYQFDRGATFLMMPHLWEELFESVQRDFHDYVTLERLDPLYELRFDGKKFSPSTDPSRTKQEIENLFPGNGDGYIRFMEKEGEKFEHVIKLLQRPLSKWTDLLSKDVFAALPKIHAADTVAGRLGRYFSDEKLKWAFSFQSKYLGMSPWECPGTFTILSYLEHRYGLWHPIGGVNQVCEAMAEVIREYGGKIHTNTGVDQIIIEKRQAKGVVLQDGSTVSADEVVINADFAFAASTLFPEGTLKKYAKAKVEKKKYSCSAFMMYVGLDRKVDMPHHSILFAKDYHRNVDEMTKQKVLSEDPSIYVHNPGKTDPTLAPGGKTALYILMPAPNLSADIDWNESKADVRNQILARLKQEPELADIEAHIELEQILTPQDWQDDMYVYKGATFNLAHSLDQMMMFRPHNQFEEVKNCWIVGGGTHPGSGLPTILESAKITSALLMKQHTSAPMSMGTTAEKKKEHSTL